MISVTAASIASRRHRLLQGSHDRQNPSPPRHSHRHPHPDHHPHRHRPRSLPKKVPLVTQTRAISAWQSESSACPVVTEDEYAHAMAARARLHARLHTHALLTCPTRVASSSAPVFRENTSSPIYSRSSGLEADAAPSAGDPSNVHTHRTTVALSEPQESLFMDSEFPASAPILNTTVQAEEFHLESDDCSICLESLSTGKILLCWPCKHRFHYKCLTTWLVAHVQCPNCRAYILKVGHCRASAGFLSTLYSNRFEKNVSTWISPAKVNSRTSTVIT